VQSIANRIIVLWGWRRLLVAFVAGALSALAFAPVYAFPVLWLTFPVLVWLILISGRLGLGPLLPRPRFW